MKTISNYINHITFVIDKSGSMRQLRDKTIQVFDNQIKNLASRSKELNQETRVSVFLFNEKVECVIYDKDVLRLPSLSEFYYAKGQTALIDATVRAIEDLFETPQRYGDHSFLTFVLTDGYENASKFEAFRLSNIIKDLPENWTLACLVPDQQGVFWAKKFGFPQDNISIWSTTQNGLDDVSNLITETTNNYFISRAKGIRGTKNLFKLNTSNLNKANVNTYLEELKWNEYYITEVLHDQDIKNFVENYTGKPYKIGSTYYQLIKKEIIQSYKQICIQDKRSSKVYSGMSARSLLGLPNNDAKVSPENYSDYDIFIQSTSVNRKLIGGTKVIILR